MYVYEHIYGHFSETISKEKLAQDSNIEYDIRNFKHETQGNALFY